MSPKTPHPIIYLLVNQQTLEKKLRSFSDTVKLLRQNFTLELIREKECKEEELIKKIESIPPALVLVPIATFGVWTKLKAYLETAHSGRTRYAAYFTESVHLTQLSQPSSGSRQVVLDFLNLYPAEILLLTKTLTHKTQSSGILPLLDKGSTVYCDQWVGFQSQGSKIDQLLSLSEITQTEWSKRSSAIRILFLSLWSFVYEEGQGKLDRIHSSLRELDQKPLAYFQFATDSHSLWMRLIFSAPHLQTPHQVLRHFWALQASPSNPVSLLHHFSDFVRVHTLNEGHDIEIVAGLFRAAPAEKSPDQLHSFWIEPISSQDIIEKAFEVPGPHAPYLKHLPNGSPPIPQIRELRTQLQAKEEKIRELRSGGIGTATPLQPPDPESLLDAFQQRYADSRFQIRQCELKIEKMRKGEVNLVEIARLGQHIDALLNREKVWIKKLAQVLEVYRKSSKTRAKG